MNDYIFAGILAAISRFLRLRKKQKLADQNQEEGIQVHLPEWIKFIILYIFMFVWIKFIDIVFYLLFGLDP